MIRAGLILAVLASPATAQQVAGAEGAVLRWLDKTTGETADIELSRGQTAQSGRLTILMDECRYPVDNPASNAFAHLTITESGRDGAVFPAGWWPQARRSARWNILATMSGCCAA